LTTGATSDPGVPVTVIAYWGVSTISKVDPAPTLNLAVSTPALTTHAGSPVVSIFNTPANGVTGAAVIVQPVSDPEKPAPEMVTSVAAAPGEPLMGGDPDVGVMVTAGVTVNGVIATSPWAPVTWIT